MASGSHEELLRANVYYAGLIELRTNGRLTFDEPAAAARAPVEFTGRKKRRLVVEADFGGQPPWGDWDRLSREPKRRHFTELRSSVNGVVTPHEVDHIDFVERKRRRDCK